MTSSDITRSAEVRRNLVMGTIPSCFDGPIVEDVARAGLDAYRTRA